MNDDVARTADAGLERLRIGGYPLDFLGLHRRDARRIGFLFLPTPDPAGAWAWLRSPMLGMPAGVATVHAMAGFSSEPEEVADDLADIAGRFPRLEEIVLLGPSIGAFPALLFGAVLAMRHAPQTVKALVFSPRTRAWPQTVHRNTPLYVVLAARAERDPALRRRLERCGDALPWVRRALAGRRADLRVMVVAGQDSRSDMAEAQDLLALPGVRSRLVPTSRHSTLLWFIAETLGEAALRDSVRGVLLPPAGPLRDEARASPAFEEQVRAEAARIRAWRATNPDLLGLVHEL
jgi:hypothetical protein